MKNNTSYTIKRAQRFPIILIGEGLLTGAVGGLLVLLYRVALTYGGRWLSAILEYISGHPARVFVWFLALLIMACIVGRLVTWEPMISGSGIPQVEGEVTGKFIQKWEKVLPAKFIGGFLCMFAGLSLGREGPSIQLGAMTGKGLSRLLGRDKTEERFLMTCGASAGLAAAFHAPLAGMMFALEEIHKGFSVSIMISVMTASVTSDYICSHIIGLDPVFRFKLKEALPQNYYWMLLLLGIICGVMGVFYNWAMLKVQDLYKKPKFLNETGRIIIAFMAAGILGLVMPSVLGSGHELIVTLTDGKMILSLIVLTFVIKFLFSTVSFGSGAPGGIFFPLLIMGAMIGGAFAMTGVELFGLDPVYINNFILLAMAGYFTAIVRAPITGIILLFEMSGSVSQLLSLAVVSVTAYIVATLLKSEPIYESLLDRILQNQGKQPVSNVKGSGQKVLDAFKIMNGSVLAEKRVQDINWPDNCLLIALKRDGKEQIPKGKTKLMIGDVLTVMTDETDAGYMHDKMEKLCYTSY
ncbi:ClC family H(+)/Cl(-) exchange transporter [Clostridium sp. C105KSO13]|uniref:ClC family H(+)/Cl(-) exchange transporter n=1 Tax=Clostridium sp. C105KSO13 TaxID=1776045 RepID=UPI000740794A|nr:ClC family H(+)/Cl(-) exchange transporter [Clostridium sp. C105KSO13]CUX31069.1 H(+)/Cl(-) exchange transporter ClcA [Clostridium sp. C105KSO13]